MWWNEVKVASPSLPFLPNGAGDTPVLTPVLPPTGQDFFGILQDATENPRTFQVDARAVAWQQLNRVVEALVAHVGEGWHLRHGFKYGQYALEYGGYTLLLPDASTVDALIRQTEAQAESED